MLKMPEIKTGNNAPMALAYVITLSKAFRRLAFLACTFLLVLVSLTLSPIYFSAEEDVVVAVTDTETLTPGDTSISITTSGDLNISFTPSSINGSFGSSAGSISVTATNPGGYDLTIAPSSSNSNNSNNNASSSSNDGTGAGTGTGSGNGTGTGYNNVNLVNEDDDSKVFVPIPGTVSTTAFSQDNETGAALNGKWGYLFYNDNGTSTDVYNELDGNTATTLDTVTTASTNTYTLGIGARAGLDLPAGTYSNTFTISAIAKAINYTITLKLNNGTTDNYYVQDGATYGTTVELYSAAPTRDGYNFLGWCSETTSDETCSGTTYQPGDSFPITESSIAATLYAMWESNAKTIDTATYMQDFATDRDTIVASMTVNQQYQLTDNRDDKTYYISKVQTSCSNPRVTAEADGKCYQVWMTQNLDLDLSTSTPLTSTNTDLNVNTDSTGIYYEGYSKTGDIIYWTPERTTVATANLSSSTFPNDNFNPYSYNPGDVSRYTSGNANADGTSPTAAACNNAGLSTTECAAHYHVGNIYNWTAAIASNNSTNLSTNYTAAANSVCPAGWKLPTGLTAASGYSDFDYLLRQQSITSKNAGTETDAGWASGGFNKIRTAPLFFVRSGLVYSGSLYNAGNNGYYWSSSVDSSSRAYGLDFNNSYVYPARSGSRYGGFSVRCVAR